MFERLRPNVGDSYNQLSKKTMEPARVIATTVDDMFFGAKIRSAAEAAGRSVRAIKSRQQLETELPAAQPALIIIDLNASRLDPLEAIAFIKSHPSLGSTPIIAFVSHVESELILKAKIAGCDYVLPRSAFSQLLPAIVSEQFEQIK